MLEPDTRSLLLDALRPPDGYELDRAIGTTFSLDLNALLTAPLAFAMFDAEANDEGTLDVIALLEATRRYASRIDIFCQAGRISVPRNYQRVYSNIEGSVHEATAPRSGGLFHPKVWALRFASRDGDEPQYRLLTLSRNLTFDRSWDIIVRLDGQRADRGNRSTTRLVNEPLVTFLKQLPEMSVRGMSTGAREAITTFADQFSEVAFEVPRPFKEMYFDSYGVSADNWALFEEEHDRALVISPFVGDSLLRQVTVSGKGHVLISRSESLDELHTKTLDSFEKVFVLDPTADGFSNETSEDELSGLHAKVFVLEFGSDSWVIAGSTNATTAAFELNVEFNVELRGRRQQVGIEAFLGTSSDVSTMLDLMIPYSREEDDGPPGEPTTTQILERKLDSFRHEIAATGLRVTVEELDSSDEFSLHISSERPLPTHDAVEIDCYPITLGNSHSRTQKPGTPVDARIPTISFEAISSFVTFDITMREGSEKQSISFVVNAELTGAPDNRHQRILSGLLSDKTKVLRYLLFLLSDPTQDGHFLGLLGATRSGGTSDGSDIQVEIPLLETLLRTLAQNPERLDPIDRLIDDLSKTAEGSELLPSGISEVWGPIWEARQGMQL